MADASEPYQSTSLLSNAYQSKILLSKAHESKNLHVLFISHTLDNPHAQYYGLTV